MSETTSMLLKFENAEQAKKAQIELIRVDKYYKTLINISIPQTEIISADGDSYDDYLLLSLVPELLLNLGCVFEADISYCCYSTGDEERKKYYCDGKTLKKGKGGIRKQSNSNSCLSCKKKLDKKDGYLWIYSKTKELRCDECMKKYLIYCVKSAIDCDMPNLESFSVDQLAEIVVHAYPEYKYKKREN